MNTKGEAEFFIGYGETPPQLLRFLLKAIVAIPVVAFLLALVLGYGVREHGGGRFIGDISATGVLVNAPYPILLTPPSSAFPQGHAYLVAGGGKTGAGAAAERLKGRMVEISGFGLKRGTLDMIVADDEAQIKPGAGEASAPRVAPVSLGRFRIAGEICDGKCYPGGMRPGTGLAHKACANLCIAGEQPAILATASPLEGQSFLLLANADGGLPPAGLFDYTALPVELEGEVLRLGDLLIFHADWTSIRKQ